MAARVWMVRAVSDVHGGRRGLAVVDDAAAAKLIAKGDALAFDNNLRRNLAELKASERAAAKAEGAPGKRRGRPPKDVAAPKNGEPPIEPVKVPPAPLADNPPKASTPKE